MTEHLTDLLERVADDAPVLRHDLVSDSMRLGTRLRHRRTALRMAGTSALVAAVVVGVTTIPRGEHRGAEPDPPVSTTSETPVVPDLTIRQATHQAFVAYGALSEPSSRVDIDFATMNATLTDASATSAGISVLVSTYDLTSFPSSSPLGVPQPTSCVGVDSNGSLDFRCHELDGVLVVSYRVRFNDDDPDDPEYANVVEVLRADGSMTGVHAYNSLGAGTGATLEQPLLDLAQLEAIALDPLWSRVQLGE